MSRFVTVLFILVLGISSGPFGAAPSCAADGVDIARASGPDDVWSGFAGWREEREGQTLELRDELIAAHLSYLSALELAVQEIADMPGDDPSAPLAWARVEYLLETSFRLLNDSGEFEAFLAATKSLTPDAFVPADPVPLDSADADGETGTAFDSGLAYYDMEGRRLVPRMVGDDLRLVDEESGEVIENLDNARAVPETAAAAVSPSSHVHLVKARAAWLRALALERLGRSEDAGRETTDLALIRDWAILGPLEGVPEYYSRLSYGLDDVYQNLSAIRAYNGKRGPAFWRPFTSVDPMGRVLPGALFRGDGLRAVIAMALVHSPENQAAVLRFGGNASALVCVNHIMARRSRYAGIPDPDQEAINVWLRKGWNVVLVRTSSPDEDWGFAARLTNPDGTPFAGRVVRPTRENLSAFLDTVKATGGRSILEQVYTLAESPASGGVSVLSDWLRDNPEDARGHFYLASFLVARRLTEGPERFGSELIFRRAVDLSHGDPFFTLMAARSVDSGLDGPDREENLRLVLLKSVADRGSTAALVDIGRLYLDVMRQPRRADDYAEMALSVNPMSLRAGVLDYDVAMTMGWDPLAESILSKLVNRHPGAAAARLRLGRAALAAGRYRQALSEYHAILGHDAANHEAIDGAVRALGMLGQTSAAVDLLVATIERFPYDFPVRLKLARLYRSLARDDDARLVVDAALEMAPDDPEALQLKEGLDRQNYAEGKVHVRPVPPQFKQELDMSSPREQPPDGWEYLYFQVADVMADNGAIDRNVSFALRLYTPRAARMLRRLNLLVDNEHEVSRVVKLDVVNPDGTREPFTPLPGAAAGGRFLLPPLRAGMVVEAEIRIRRERIGFLGEYFGHIAPLGQPAPIRVSRYLFTAPKDRRVFFKAVNGAPEALEIPAPDGSEVIRVWEMANVPAFQPEPYSPGEDALAPCVQVSSFGSWDDFARWYWRLIGVQYHSPPELRVLARRFGPTDGSAMDRLDSAATWVSRNIANRPWDYGPYAFRPINARSILSRLSADEKDRTLLLCLFARELGLEAWPVLARARGRAEPTGSDDMALPLLDHFNHSLALVHSPLGGDIFMDASNPYRPPAVMPSILNGASGMVVTPRGAERVVIPDSGIAACEWREESDLVLDQDGSILWDQRIRAVGTAAEILRRRFAETRAVESRGWRDFIRSIGGDPSTLTDEFEEDPKSPASVTWSGRARLRRFATMEEERVILNVPPLPGDMLPTGGEFRYPLGFGEFTRHGERGLDLLLPHGFRIERRVNLHFPEGWRLVNPADALRREYPFGHIAVETRVGTGTVAIDLVVEVPGHVVRAGDFVGFREMAAEAERWILTELVWEKL